MMIPKKQLAIRMSNTRMNKLNLIKAIPILLLYSGNAQAYFDPGVGSIIVQSLVAAGAFLAIFWNNLKMLVKSKLGSSKQPDEVKPEINEININEDNSDNRE